MQALQYMRALCSHPLLALDASNPAHVELATSHTGTSSWADAQLSLQDLQHSPKLMAFRYSQPVDLPIVIKPHKHQPAGTCGPASGLLLASKFHSRVKPLRLACPRGPPQCCSMGSPRRWCRDILHQLGIGLSQEGGQGEQAEGHRVLVFAQLRGMLDLVARDVLQPLGVPHLRIDGGHALRCAAVPALTSASIDAAWDEQLRWGPRRGGDCAGAWGASHLPLCLLCLACMEGERDAQATTTWTGQPQRAAMLHHKQELQGNGRVRVLKPWACADSVWPLAGWSLRSALSWRRSSTATPASQSCC